MFWYFLPYTSSLICMSTMLTLQSLYFSLMRLLTKVPSLLVFILCLHCNYPKIWTVFFFLSYTVMHRDADGVTGSVDFAHSVPFFVSSLVWVFAAYPGQSVRKLRSIESSLTHEQLIKFSSRYKYMYFEILIMFLPKFGPLTCQLITFTVTCTTFPIYCTFILLL